MINLLQPETKRQIRAARLNIILIRYCFLLVLGALFLLGIFGVGFYVTTQNKADAATQLQSNQQEAAKYAEVKKEAEDFQANLKNAKAILSSDISFSQLITNIAAILPHGVILSNLNLTTATIGTPLTLTARATSYQTGVDLKNQLQQSQIFTKVSIQSISTNAPSTDPNAGFIDKNYPITVTLSATLTSKAAVSSNGGKS